MIELFNLHTSYFMEGDFLEKELDKDTILNKIQKCFGHEWELKFNSDYAIVIECDVTTIMITSHQNGLINELLSELKEKGIV